MSKIKEAKALFKRIKRNSEDSESLIETLNKELLGKSVILTLGKPDSVREDASASEVIGFFCWISNEHGSLSVGLASLRFNGSDGKLKMTADKFTNVKKLKVLP